METLLRTADTDVQVAATPCDSTAATHHDALVVTFLAASRALDDDLPQFWD